MNRFVHPYIFDVDEHIITKRVGEKKKKKLSRSRKTTNLIFLSYVEIGP